MRKAVPLTKRQIAALGKKLTKWQLIKKDTQIKRSVELEHYMDGVSLIARIAIHAEVKNHHPELQYEYDCISIILTTHSAKGLTSADIELAQIIDQIIP